jgi:hypothetical protein
VSHTLSLHNVVSTQRLCRYLGVVLKDLTGLSFLKTWSTDGDDDNKKTPHTEKTLNFTKYRGVSRVIGAVTRATSKAVLRFGEDYDEDEELISRLLELATTTRTDDELYVRPSLLDPPPPSHAHIHTNKQPNKQPCAYMRICVCVCVGVCVCVCE